jgi:rod shape-determining protein MreC
VILGLPVIDNAGVVGQVTRVFPFTSEVTLLTDKEQAIPVQVLRSGLRSVAYGRGHSNLLDLRFVAPNADIQVGDVLVTSGLDGVYPAGLAVAKVIQVESVGQGAFGRVVCQPLAGIDRNRQLLIVMSNSPAPPRPLDEPARTPASKKNLPKMEPIAPPPLPATPLPPQAPATATSQPAQAPAAAPNAGTQPHPAATGTGATAAPAAAPRPGQARPATTQPATQPAGAPPGATQPATGRPPATTPATTQPGATQPAGTPPAGAQGTAPANQGARAATPNRPTMQAQAGAKKEGL